MRRQAINGQTLIEVMVTAVFITMAVLALIRFQNYQAYDSMLTQQKNAAMLLATQELETLRNFQVLNTTSGYTAYSSIASGSSSPTVGNTTYTVTWTVTYYSNPNPTYDKVNVVVSWTDRNSNAQSVEICSNIAGINPPDSGALM